MTTTLVQKLELVRPSMYVPIKMDELFYPKLKGYLVLSYTLSGFFIMLNDECELESLISLYEETL